MQPNHLRSLEKSKLGAHDLQLAVAGWAGKPRDTEGGSVNGLCTLDRPYQGVLPTLLDLTGWVENRYLNAPGIGISGKGSQG